MKNLLLILTSFVILNCNHPESSDYQRYKEYNSPQAKKSESFETVQGNKIIGIKDGDTFVVLISGQEQVVRLEHIDCPEKKQPFGSQAKKLASDLCFGRYVELKHNNKYDRNRRLIAEIVLLEGLNVNQELVRKGLAWHYKKYSDNDIYSALEIDARNRHAGIWSQPNPIAPWDWRKHKRSRNK